MLIDAYKYKSWADTRTFEALDRVDRRRASVEFVLQQLNHMTIVEEMFRSRLSGNDSTHEKTNTKTVPSAAVLLERNSISNQWYSEYCSVLTVEEQSQRVNFVFADGKPGCLTRIEILFHVLNHGSYHRGAISHALDLSGVAHPVDGYAAFAHSSAGT